MGLRDVVATPRPSGRTNAGPFASSLLRQVGKRPDLSLPARRRSTSQWILRRTLNTRSGDADRTLTPITVTLSTQAITISEIDDESRSDEERTCALPSDERGSGQPLLSRSQRPQQHLQPRRRRRRSRSSSSRPATRPTPSAPSRRSAARSPSLPIVDGVAARVPVASVADLGRAPGVLAVTPNQSVTTTGLATSAAPNTASVKQAFLQSTGAAKLHARSVRGTHRPGTPTRVALIDTGVDTESATTGDLAGRVVPVRDPRDPARQAACVDFSGERPATTTSATARSWPGSSPATARRAAGASPARRPVPSSSASRSPAGPAPPTSRSCWPRCSGRCRSGTATTSASSTSRSARTAGPTPASTRSTAPSSGPGRAASSSSLPRATAACPRPVSPGRSPSPLTTRSC